MGGAIIINLAMLKIWRTSLNSITKTYGNKLHWLKSYKKRNIDKQELSIIICH